MTWPSQPSGIASRPPAYMFLRQPAISSPSDVYMRVASCSVPRTSDTGLPAAKKRCASLRSSATTSRTEAWPPTASYASRTTRMNCPFAILWLARRERFTRSVLP
jgi:hypothetical protein